MCTKMIISKIILAAPNYQRCSQWSSSPCYCSNIFGVTTLLFLLMGFQWLSVMLLTIVVISLASLHYYFYLWGFNDCLRGHIKQQWKLIASVILPLLNSESYEKSQKQRSFHWSVMSLCETLFIDMSISTHEFDTAYHHAQV